MNFKHSRTVSFYIIYTTVILSVINCELANNSPAFKGTLIGPLNSYDHNVSGVVYQVNKKTLLLTDFTYDGRGEDTYFCAGSASKPGPRGFIIPDEFGTTNVLEKYDKKDFNLTLPGAYEIDEISWFSIYDIHSHISFGEIYLSTYSTSKRPYE